MNAFMPGLPAKIYDKLEEKEMPTWAEAITKTGTARGHPILRSSANHRAAAGEFLIHNTASVTRLLRHLDSFEPVAILLPQLCNLAGMLMCDRYGWMEPQGGNESVSLTVDDAELKRKHLLMFCVTQDPAHAVSLVAKLLVMRDSNDVKDVIFVGEGIVYLQLHEPPKQNSV